MDIQFDNAAVFDLLKGGSEVSQNELKKQHVQAKRFNDSALKGHPQAENIRNAIQILKPEQLIQVLHDTRIALKGAGEGNSENRHDVPQLAAPSSSQAADKMNHTAQEKLSAGAQLTELLAKITTITGEASIQNINNQLKEFNSMFQGTTKKFSEMSNELMQKGHILAQQQENLIEKNKEVETIENEVLEAEKTLDSAQNSLTNAKELRDNLKKQIEKEASSAPAPKNSSTQEKLLLAEKAVSQAQNEVDVATIRLDAAKNLGAYGQETLAEAQNAVNKARSNLSDARTQAQELVKSVSPTQQSAIEAQRKQQDSSSLSLTFIMALISQLIDKSASEDLKSASELKQMLAEAAQKDAEAKAEEYEEQVRKAEEAQKTMGCIGKIVGWAITAIGVAAAAFTGGASLAIAAVGLAMAVGDEIYQAVTGDSLMQKVMEPLMKGIIQPMMKLFGELFSSILEMAGVDKSTSDMVGQIMGAITAAIMMVVGMAVAGAAMSKLGGTAIGRAASKVAEQTSKKMMSIMQKVVGSSARQAFKRVTQKFSSVLKVNDLKIMKYTNYVNQGTTAAQFANTTATGAVNIYAADLLVKASEAQAKITTDIALQDLLNQMLEQSIEHFKNRISTANQIIKNMAAAAEDKLQTGKYITRQMRAIAG